MTAGLTFSLPHSAGQLVQRCAAQIFGERAKELACAADKLAVKVPLPGVGAQLQELAVRFDELHACFEEHLSLAVDNVTKIAAAPHAPMPAVSTDDGGDPNVERGQDVTIRFDTKRCIHSRHCVLDAPQVFQANTPGRWLHPDAASVEHVVGVAHNCPSWRS